MTLASTRWAVALGLTLATGCAGGGGGTTAGETTTGTTGGTTTGTTGSTTTGTSSGGPEATTSGTTSGSSGEGPTTSGSSSSATTGAVQEYCWLDVDAPAPTMKLDLLGGQAFADGAVWPIECGGQGLWMFALYPSVGGWDPMALWVDFVLTIDVEGFNDNPEGHFFSGPVGFFVGCGLDGGVTGIVPVLPPDTIADLSVLDGLPATVHVEVTAGQEVLTADAAVTLAAPKDQLSMGCKVF